MSLMNDLLAQFDEEISGVEEYVRCAEENKDDPEIRKMYLSMATAELEHARNLQNALDKKASAKVTPEEALEILEKMWAEQKVSMIDRITKARFLLEAAKP